MAALFRKRKKNDNGGLKALSETELEGIGGGYEKIEDKVLGQTVYRGIDENGSEFYTTDETLTKNKDISKQTNFATPFNMEAALKARNSANGEVVYLDNN
jgi:hypothetical protein